MPSAPDPADWLDSPATVASRVSAHLLGEANALSRGAQDPGGAPIGGSTATDGDLTAGWEEFGNATLQKMLESQGINASAAAALCGPIAAAGLARAFGIDTDPARLAKTGLDNGWWKPGVGMAAGSGVGVQKLLATVGLPSDVRPADQQSIADATALLQRHIPVVANFPNHYLLLQAVRTTNKGTAEYFVGSTGSNALAGQGNEVAPGEKAGDWMTLAEMNAASGNGGPMRALVVPTAVAVNQGAQDPGGALVGSDATASRAPRAAGGDPGGYAPGYAPGYGTAAPVPGQTRADEPMLTEADTSSRQAFVNDLLPIAQAHSAQTGIPAEWYVAAAAHESNFGKGAIGSNMLFGIKAHGSNASVNLATREGSAPGGSYATTQDFSAYPTVNAAFDDFDQLVTQGRYAGAYQQFQKDGDAYQYFKGLQKAGYAGASNWGDSVRSLLETTVKPLVAQAAPTRGRGPGMASPLPSANGTTPADAATSYQEPAEFRDRNGYTDPREQYDPPVDEGPAGPATRSPLAALPGDVDYQDPRARYAARPSSSPTALGATTNPSLVSPAADRFAGATADGGSSVNAIDALNTAGKPLQPVADAASALAGAANFGGQVTSTPSENVAAIGHQAEKRFNEGLQLALSLPVPAEFKAAIIGSQVAGVPAEAIQAALTAGEQNHGSIPAALEAGDGYYRRFKSMGWNDTVASVAAFGAMAALDPLNLIPMHAPEPALRAAVQARSVLTDAGVEFGRRILETPPVGVFDEMLGRPALQTAGRAVDSAGRIASDVETNTPLSRLLPPESAPPQATGTLPGTRSSTAPSTLPADLSAGPGTRLPEPAVPDRAASLAEGNPAAPLDASVAPASRRMYHGTGGAFETPDPGKFDPNGLFGPGYYLTSDARVAGNYASERAPRAITGADDAVLAQLQSQLKAYEDSGLDGAADDVRDEIARLHEQAAGITAGPNIRAVDVPENLRLLDADTPGQEAANQVRQMFAQRYSQETLRDFERHLPQAGTITGQDVYNAVLRTANQDKTEAANLLTEAGFDGIAHGGGQRVPMFDAAGQPIEHAVTVVFPESLGKIRNAISGRQGGQAGILPAIHGAGGAAGAATGYETSDPNATERERFERAALFGAIGLGFVGGATMAGRAVAAGRAARAARFADPGLDQIVQMFDRSNATPSIMARLWEGVKGLPLTLESALTDDKAFANKISARAAKAVGASSTFTAPVAQDLESALVVASGKAAGAVRWAEDGLRPVARTLGNADNLAAFNTMVKLRRDIETAGLRVGRGANAAQIQFSGGVTSAADAAAKLARLEQKVGPQAWQKLQDAERLYHAHLNSVLDAKVQAGLVAPDFAAWLKANHPNYSPVMLQDMEDRIAMLGGKNIQVTTKGIKALTQYGHAADDVAPLTAATAMTLRESNRITNNTTVRTFVNAMRLDPTMAGLFTQVQHEGPKTITFFENGTRVHYEVPDPVRDMVLALGQTGQPNALVSIFRAANDVARAGITRLNLPFAVINGLADMATVAVGEHHIMPWDIFREYPGLFKENQAVRDAMDLLHLNSAQDPLISRALRAGGGQQGYQMGRGLEGAKDVERAILRSGGIVIDQPGDLVRAAKSILSLQPVEALGSVIENAPRMATFRKLERQGVDATRAAVGMRRVSVDFQRGGALIKQLNGAVLFLNAGVQGTLWTTRLAAHNPKAFAFGITGLGALGLSSYAWNRQFKRSDGQLYYDDVPDYVRQTNLVYMDPTRIYDQGTPKERMGYYTVPLRQLGLFANLPVIAARKLEGAADNPIDEITSLFLRTTSPIQGDSVAQALGGFLPGPIATGVETWAGKDFYTGLPIKTRGMEGLPPERQVRDTTGITARRLGSALNVSPEDVNHWTQSFGGLAQQGQAALDLAQGDSRGGDALYRSSIGRIRRDQGGQLERDKGTDFDTQLAARLSEGLALLKQSPAWQNAASEDDRNVLIRQMQAKVRDSLVENLGSDAPAYTQPDRKGEPFRWDPTKLWNGKTPHSAEMLQKYGDPAVLERAMLDAADTVSKWTANGKKPPNPSNEAFELAKLANMAKVRTPAWRSWAVAHGQDVQDRAETTDAVTQQIEQRLNRTLQPAGAP